MNNAEKANKKFCCEYAFGGFRWTFEIWASTLEEAEMKLKAVGKGKVNGLLGEKIPGGWCPTCGREMDGAP